MRTSIVRSNVITAIIPGLGWWTNSDSVHRWSLRPLLTRSFSMFSQRRCVTRSPANVFNMRRRLVNANLCWSQLEYSLSLSCVSLSPSLWVLQTATNGMSGPEEKVNKVTFINFLHCRCTLTGFSIQMMSNLRWPWGANHNVKKERTQPQETAKRKNNDKNINVTANKTQLLTELKYK